MSKFFTILILSLFLLVSAVSASSDVDVVVLGVISHGPMQPTVNAIKEVTSKYPDVNVRWLDLESNEGEKYAQEHGLTAHMNVLIDDEYQYSINGKDVTFQWFEGQQWTKEDLDNVISSKLNNSPEISVSDNPKSGNNMNVLIVWAGIFAVVGIIAWFLIKKFRKG
ncbi:LPXTG cell wall anchor domain-containing protein [archaeon]|jgi:LPXTG-motif cell wall-anchored protein|nr:LPXTG cell wall anchor domain-containing protein [archaeon]MBT7903631.1 LPXTG cell wall anchor domain-containing protein [Candidatus Woesearchaeota archaeon]MBT4376019.1 LPXTG cell wall anchor domain-containing protein [archaeon]MBT4669974.1 LPXTG cell wall anchor domain-containing protein [archaeon]MBT5287447.1 LPXTG cell wall anchor domain-containing protein [archaeon]